MIQLNKGESRHSLARATYFGQKGEVCQRYREGQEEQLAALGLIVNAIVLWIMWSFAQDSSSFSEHGRVYC